MFKNIKIKRVASSSVGLKYPSPIKIKLKSKKNTLSNILKEVNFFKYKKLDKNSILSYNNRLKFKKKPKTASRSVAHFNNTSAAFIPDNESIISKKIKIKLPYKPIWNYSYYYNEMDNNKKYYKLLNHNYSDKKLRIKNLLNTKNPYMVEDWQKPRMIRILEKNSLIEEEILLRPWNFLPYLDN